MKKNRCIFCDIVSNKLNADIVYRSDSVIAFKDIHPKAPVHILIIPKEHIPTLNDLKPNHQNLIGEMFLAAQEIAKKIDFFDASKNKCKIACSVSEFTPSDYLDAKTIKRTSIYSLLML